MALLAMVVSVAVTAQVVAALPASAVAKPQTGERPKTQKEHAVKTRKVRAKPHDIDTSKGARPDLRGSWPKPGSAVVDFAPSVNAQKDQEQGQATSSPSASASSPRTATSPSPAARTAPTSQVAAPQQPVRAGSLPVWIGRPQQQAKLPSGAVMPGRVKVQVLDSKTATGAGLYGVVMKVGADASATAQTGATAAAAGGRVSLSLDYSGFRGMGGAGWAQRLHLVKLPECALTSPRRTGCQPQPLAGSSNDARASRLSADLDVPAATQQPMLLAAVAGSSGPAGDYSASSLSPSSTWQVSNQSGAFSWSYPLRVPPSLAGPTPTIGLSYSSGAVDGRTSSTNNQTSWLGEGFDYWPGYVERKFKSCSDDGQTGTPPPGDQCWDDYHATLSLNGSSLELVRDDSTGKWRPKDDDGSKIEWLSGAANGDEGGSWDVGEHWRVTTADGTQYYFGLNHLPGWASGKTETNSTWTVPVAGDDSGEPCYASTGFKDSFCNQAWRWNLDYVVDPRGNAMSLWYGAETNYYAKNKTASPASPYTRGGYLSRIDYGLAKDNLFTAKAPQQVVFDVQERCFKGATECADAKFTVANRANWPDVPVDQNCAKDATCSNKFSPTFWTRKRLAGITTQILNGTTYKPVDTWAFDQSIVAAGDTSDPSLRLNGITHTGKATGTGVVGGAISLPKVKFGYTQMPNRVDGIGDSLPAFLKWRLVNIDNESGGGTNITYSPSDCTKDSLPSPQDNTRLCFPQRIIRPGATDPKDLITDWMHKYVVTDVSNADYVGGASAEDTHYKYLDKPAWHYADDDALVPARLRTWSQWRGYSQVRVLHGSPSGKQTRTDYLYFRGMDGDRANADGTQTKTAKIVDSEGTEFDDRERLQGYLRERIQYKEVSGGELSGTINTPWEHGPTSTQGKTTAWMIDTARTRSRTALNAPGSYQRTELVKEFNDDGTVKQQWDKGDTGSAVGDGDDKCTQTTYTGNSAKGITSLPERVWTVAKPCGQDPKYPDDAVSDTKTTYDLSYGEPTKTEEADSYSGSTPTYVTTTQTTYDSLGRPKDTFDGLNNKTSTTYTGTSLVTGRTVTNALNQASTQTIEPSWGLPVTTKDANGNTSTTQYDSLGRVVKAWGPGRTTDKTPNAEFAYQMTQNAATAITTKELMPNGQQKTSYQLLDGLLRPRQTQEPSASTYRVVTDTYYDSRGLVWKTNQPYVDKTGTPGTTLLTPTQDNSVPGQTIITYDGAERPVVSTLYSYATEQWHTTTAYGGDRTTVTPPKGGIMTTAITDARGKTVEQRQYKNGTVSDDPADYNATKYAYTPAGELSAVTDAAGNQWKYTYDLHGNKKTLDDPDKGLTKVDYNAAGGIAKTTDAENRTLKFTYDALGRRTFEHQVATDGTETKLAEWTYDTVTGGKGMPAKSIRWSGGQAYTQEVTKYDAAYRPLESQVTIPTTEGNLGKTYQTSLTYDPDGSVDTLTMPAAGGLAKETVTSNYNALGQATTVSGLDAYAQGAAYTDFGELSQLSLGTFTSKRVWLTNYYEDGTRRLQRSRTDRQDQPVGDDDVNYSYDAAGNITKIADTPTSAAADVQCFQQDNLQRLTQAWTATDNCAQAPTKDNAKQIIGGAQPYWQTYSYDNIGNRTASADHDVTGDTTKDHNSTYDYNTSSQPHTLASMTTSWGGDGIPESGTAQNTYGYDKVGNTTTRKIGGDDQKLSWDAEGRLSKVTEPDGSGGTKTSTYLYDANGNLLIRSDANSSKTLFLDGQELAMDRAGTVAATRYYSHGDNTIAVRTAKGVSWLIPERQGSAQIAIDAKTQNITRRRYLPFGQLRTNPDSWPGTKSFVGGTPDPNTSMVHLGAREYDPDTGRFASTDPVFDPTDPAQMNGYAYANNNPETLSDPSGLSPCHRDGSQCEYPGSPGNGTGANSQTGSDRWTLRKGNSDHRNGNAYWTGRGGSSDAEAAAARRQALEQAARAMRARVAKAQSRLANAAQVIAKIAADELGITAGLDCLTTGDLSSCGETALNVISSFAGGLAGKLVAKYGLKWRKAARLVKSLYSATKEVVAGIKDWIKARRELKVAEEALESAGSCALNSFTPNTRVLLANGKSKPISEVKPGDKVLSTNPRTGKTTAKIVTARFSGKHYKNVVQLTIGTGVVSATEHHLFWDPDRHSWIRADSLRQGESVRTPSGRSIRVTQTANSLSLPVVYDLTVADMHTFYVLAGSTPVLVHNCAGWIDGHHPSCLCARGEEPVLSEPPVPDATEVDDFTRHATQRLKNRGVSAEDAQSVLGRDPFSYRHDGQWKLGYYDPGTKVFVAKTIDGNVNTVMVDVTQAYIDRLAGG
ncbi:type IV secretion protein Rhs [Actinomadura barringtoniae]|uniref:Type IV secretion protein Rhs n=1 Tax=Actinomadura barringtoniae TaxID=1427535 RepID=A0A939P6G6_9ACTN|nr:polymorphic toxin-type HINT domain-containing protein [Actinomadura barringtoniae]MBO2446381.1 type IV secretion protein Rhs [Actinomadura barringtoniae]